MAAKTLSVLQAKKYEKNLLLNH